MKSFSLVQRDGCKAFYVEGQKDFIQSIFFFDKGEIIGFSSNGFFNIGNENIFQKVFFDKEIKNKRKLNLFDKQIYTYKKDLFIHKDLLKNFKLRKGALETHEPFFNFYTDEITLTIDAIKYKNDDYNKKSYERETEYSSFDVTIESNCRVENTELYYKCQKISEKAKEQFVFISEGDVQRLLEVFDITFK